VSPLPGGGVEIRRPSKLELGEDDFRPVVEEIRRSGEFSIAVRFRPQSLSQVGPARIVSASWDTRNRNFTLGQEGASLELRVRTPLSGPNGSHPSLQAPGCLSADRAATAVATYAGGRLRLYLDGGLAGARRTCLLGWLAGRAFDADLSPRVLAGLGLAFWTIACALLWAAIERSGVPRSKALLSAALGAWTIVAALAVASALVG
jgi:hypothetical protein